MPRPICARINLAALRRNYLTAKKRTPNTQAWAVVKANAYGHGLLRTARALSPIADGFALLDLAEAIALRDAGIRQPILLLEGFFEPADIPLCTEYRLTPVVHCLEQLAMLRTMASPTRLPIYLKLNTGMNRLGITATQLPAAQQAIAAAPAIGNITLMTHFADADGDYGIDWQLARFSAMRDRWPGSDNFPVSLANSAAIVRHPQTAGDWVRPGIMLYGGSPFANDTTQSAASLGLRPVMTLESRIIAIQEIAAGERVGYGGLFIAQQAMRLGIVACGYADGYPRHASSSEWGTSAPILVAGRRTQTLGRVSMDMITCDLTDLPEAGVGSPVVLWGEGLAADEVAAAAGTVSYELFCALAARVPIQEIDEN